MHLFDDLYELSVVSDFPSLFGYYMNWTVPYNDHALQNFSEQNSS